MPGWTTTTWPTTSASLGFWGSPFLDIPVLKLLMQRCSILCPASQAKPQVGADVSSPETLKAFIVWLPVKLLAIWSALVKTWSSDLRRLALKYERAVWEFTSSQANQVYWASGFPSVRVRFVSGLSPAQKWLRHFQKYCRVLAKVILCLVCCRQN